MCGFDSTPTNQSGEIKFVKGSSADGKNDGFRVQRCYGSHSYNDGVAAFPQDL